MLPKWGRFMMPVKLNRGLKESNNDQLYAYLKQHELHANENKMLMERLNQHSHDPLTLVSNDSPYQYPSSSTNRVQGNNVRGAAATCNEGAQYRAGNANVGKGKPIKCYNCNEIGHIARNCIQLKRPQNSDCFKEKKLLMQARENRVDLDEEQLLFLAGGQTNTFDDETMFMANLSSTDPVYDEAGLSYDSDTLSEVQDHDNYLDNMNESHKEHEIHNGVQPNDVVNSYTKYTSNSNIISYEQSVQDNKDQVVHNDVSSVPNDAVMIITNDIYEQDASCVTFNNIVNAFLTAELARYKELTKVYEKRAQFKLTEREIMIDTQMRLIIKDRNVKDESLQKELHSVKMQLNSTLNHSKLIKEEISTLKQDVKQKENKLLEESLDMKHLKEKVKDNLYKKISLFKQSLCCTNLSPFMMKSIG
nr:DNA-binding protein HEXBP-like [Tanacetum cinerariifolium]